METKKSKYDTNPLDPDVEQTAEQTWGDTSGENSKGSSAPDWMPQQSQPVREEKEDPRKNVYSEAPTHRYENPPLEAPYPSVFIPPPYSPPQEYHAKQNVYQPNPHTYQTPVTSRPTSRPVPGMGIPEKWAVMMPYAPAYVGLVFSLLELFLVPRRETKVRFHASQALALHIGILIIHTLFGVISTFTGSTFGGSLFTTAATIFLIISMIRVWKGRPHHIAPLTEPGQWFNDHIEPRNR